MTDELRDPVPLLQRLIRLDTTNPPGRERLVVDELDKLLRGIGLVPTIVGCDDERPNLVVRLPGAGLAPPMLLHAHSDVVPTTGQQWSVPPFEGLIRDGHVWGRGAIDMKGGLAMMLAALHRFVDAGEVPAGDVILAVVADEEAGSAVGAHHLVHEHPELVSDAAYCVGEDGGAGFTAGGLRYQPIVVAEKRAGWLRATLRGPGGHGSRRRPDSAMGRLAKLLDALYSHRLPTHLTPAADRMLAELGRVLPDPVAGHIAAFRAGGEIGPLLTALPESDAVYVDSVTRHTANVTVVRTSDKINMQPAEITVDIDGRILPGGYTVEDFTAEVVGLIGTDVEVELLLEGDAMPAPTFGGFFDLLTELSAELDPDAVALPMITPASTDARLFAGLGMACYGWLPLRVPPGSRYHELLHAPDERVPVDALRFGADCLYQLMRRYR